MLIAVLLAFAAGASFALGAYLQQSVASTRPEDESLSPRLLGNLARQPRWLGGIGLDFGSYALKAAALAFGPLVLVQPVVASNLLIAVPLSLRRHGLRLQAREWTGAALVVAGLAIAIFSARPSGEEDVLPSLVEWGGLFGAVALAGVLALVVGRRFSGPVRASTLAVAAAFVLATQGALMKATIVLFQRGISDAFTSWEPYAMAVASIGGLLLVQSAYQAGPLAASMPVIDVVNPLTAIAIGIVLFSETVNTGLLPLLGAVTGLAALVAGIIVLDTSPRVHRAHAEEEEESEQTEREEQER